MNLPKFDIKSWVRPNILSLKPYSSAREEFTGDAYVYLDANENPYPDGYNRYPDPNQTELKKKLELVYEAQSEQIFVGNGSDEAIDLLIRASCEPEKDRILSISPSYGMYEVCANIQNVQLDKVLLDTDFSLNTERILKKVTPRHKLLFLCSPNNPTGNVLDSDSIRYLLENFHGVVVVDEAYMDFSDEPSNISLLAKYTNLVVLRTFSKAWGMAGVRCGVAIADPGIIRILSRIKYPYNLNQLTQNVIIEAIQNQTKKKQQLQKIRSEREILIKQLNMQPGIAEVFSSEANFVLIKVSDPLSLYQYLIRQGIVVRDRSKQDLCDGCLRLTIGTPEENQELISEIKNYLS